ncbi:hypothetical protein TSOC_000462 [Tetrabaena socialis]|uniref:Uncharacterized protein n=1 Tax=Tetrabaena socialis TaxID=47790 RepID=A0A2J8AJA6_9CHLO|nr:hypothetical protein TSOC_000462 [Tetrabaena socialis]|eukprot:PNH12598.1 hypothetical protein TSOC_000462 [Tetrabaena socialis]
MSEDRYAICLESKFCYNIKTEHKSNNVYIIVTPENVQQACHLELVLRIDLSMCAVGDGRSPEAQIGDQGNQVFL